MKRMLLSIAVLVSVISCTDNTRARKFGGTEEITLKPNEKLLNITWKDNDLWVLTIDTLTQTKYFREKSKYGVFQGEIKIK